MMFFLLWGFIVWLGATSVFRLGGQFFFSFDYPMLLIAAYILVVPFIFILTIPIYRWKKLNQYEQLKAAMLTAFPGMLLDVIVLVYFSSVFVNLEPETDGLFGSWLLWAYSFILLTGFCGKKSK